MTPEQFTYWLQGFMELHDELPSEKQWKMIREHLQTVFHKVTSSGDKSKASDNLTEAVRRSWSGTTTIC